jgi:hypothetical protein
VSAERTIRISGKATAMLAAAAALFVASMFLPLWCTVLESPQYHGEDKIVIEVYPGRVTGNLREVETLNQYIGVHLPLDAPELRALPWALGAFALLTIVAALLKPALRRKALVVNLVAMVASGVAGAAALQWRLYQLGHERTHSVLTRVPDFTPPIVGSIHLENFHVETELMIGAWLIALAIGLTALAWYASGHDTIRLPSLALFGAHHHVAETR